jgi:hypothetical protein
VADVHRTNKTGRDLGMGLETEKQVIGGSRPWQKEDLRQLRSRRRRARLAIGCKLAVANCRW